MSLLPLPPITDLLLAFFTVLNKQVDAIRINHRAVDTLIAQLVDIKCNRGGLVQDGDREKIDAENKANDTFVKPSSAGQRTQTNM